MTNISYILASRKADLLTAQDGLADIVANVETAAYKEEKDIFGTLLARTSSKEQLSFSHISSTERSTQQGPLIATNRTLDVAINGKGYFMVETPLGTRYTRAGNFKVSSEGVLITHDGYPIIGPGGGQVEFAESDTNIKIKEDGLVTANGEDRGQIGVFQFENEKLLERTGSGLYRSPEIPQPGEDYQVAQGMLEGSNVNSVLAMTNLANIARSIENIKVIESQTDQLQRDALRRIVQ